MTNKVNAVLLFSAKNVNNHEILMPKEIEDQASQLVESGVHSRQAIAVASVCAVYADHVTAALQAEIDALKQQRDELLRALHNLTENVTFYHTYGISDLKDAKADRNNAVKIALIAIGIDFEPDLEFNDWQPLPITKAKGGQS